jgi:hypothetical protein
LVLSVGKLFTVVVRVIFDCSFYPNLSNWNTTAKNDWPCWEGPPSSHCSKHWTIACNCRICHGKFLTNTNPRVNDIRSTDVKEILLIWTLGANPIAAMGIDIIEVDTISNPKQHRGGCMLSKMVVPMDGRMQAKLQRYYNVLWILKIRITIIIMSSSSI